MTKETLEEAAENHISNDLDVDLLNKLFIEGAKWQAERMYSEEDLREAFIAGQKHNQWSFSCPSFSEWFKQVKKK